MLLNGNLNLPGSVFVGRLTPVTPSELTSKQYVDSLLGAFIARSGDSMSGFLTLNADPASPLHAATKRYVDSLIGTGLTTAGGTMTGYLTLHADPINPMHATTKQYTDTKVSLTGDTMTGPLTLSANPTLPLHSAAKDYVDSIAGSDGINLGSGFAVFAGKVGADYTFKTLTSGPNVTITQSSTEVNFDATLVDSTTVAAGTNVTVDVVGNEFTVNAIAPQNFIELGDAPSAYSNESLVKSTAAGIEYSTKTKLSSDDHLYGHRELLVQSTVDVTPTVDDSNKTYVLDSLVDRLIVLDGTSLTVGHTNKFITSNAGDWTISTADTVLGELSTYGNTDELRIRLVSKAPNVWQTFLSDVSTDRINVFKKANSTIPVKASVSGTITPDFSQSNIYQYLVVGDLTIAEPINVLDGQVIRIRIQQDAVGGHNIVYPASFKFPGAHTPSGSANSVDLYTLTYFADYNRYEAIISKGLV